MNGCLQKLEGSGACREFPFLFLFALSTFQGLGLAEGMTVGKQAGVQLIGIVAVAAWSAIASYIIIMIARALFGLRVPEEDEIEGLDITSHGERGYDL